MAKNMLGKVVAGAALGGASLLAFTPGIALADATHGGGEGHHDAKGKVFADPHVVKPGSDVTLIEVCAEPQKHAYVWSDVTGKVKLHPRQHDKGGKDRDWRGGDGSDEQGNWGRDTGRTGEQGRDTGRTGEQGRDWEDGQAEEGRGENGPQRGTGQERADSDQRGADQRGAEQRGAGERGEPDAMNQPETNGQGGGDNGAGKHEGRKDAAGKDGQPMDPATAESGRDRAKFVYYGKAEIPWNAQPGTYELKGSCGEGRLIVMPKGHVDGGDGGASGTDAAASGAAMLGAAALGGIVLMRRRRTHESLV